MRYLSVFNKSVKALNMPMYVGKRYTSSSYIYEIVNIHSTGMSYKWAQIDEFYPSNFNGIINADNLDVFSFTRVEEIK